MSDTDERLTPEYEAHIRAEAYNGVDPWGRRALLRELDAVRAQRDKAHRQRDWASAAAEVQAHRADQAEAQRDALYGAHEAWCEAARMNLEAVIARADRADGRLRGGITVWRFQDAPPEYQALSHNGGDEDWLAFIPDGFPGGEPHWMGDSADRGWCNITESYDVDGGHVVIGSHA
jgi:hypothetical protein